MCRPHLGLFYTLLEFALTARQRQKAGFVPFAVAIRNGTLGEPEPGRFMFMKEVKQFVSEKAVRFSRCPRSACPIYTKIYKIILIICQIDKIASQ
jgi:hypothetical protein